MRLGKCRRVVTPRIWQRGLRLESIILDEQCPTHTHTFKFQKFTDMKNIYVYIEIKWTPTQRTDDQHGTVDEKG